EDGIPGEVVDLDAGRRGAHTGAPGFPASIGIGESTAPIGVRNAMDPAHDTSLALGEPRRLLFEPMFALHAREVSAKGHDLAVYAAPHLPSEGIVPGELYPDRPIRDDRGEGRVEGDPVDQVADHRIRSFAGSAFQEGPGAPRELHELVAVRE